jgi:hypothetical protein
MGFQSGSVRFSGKQETKGISSFPQFDPHQPPPPSLLMTASALDNVIRLQSRAGSAAQGLRSVLDNGRYELVPAGPNPEFNFIGSDPYNTNAYTGLVVPSTPSSAIGNARYLFMLCRSSFGTGEQSRSKQGVRLVGMRQYVDLVARIPAGVAPLDNTAGPSSGTVPFHREIESPLWHPPDGNISWHVMIIAKGFRDTRNPANRAGLIYEDALSPAMLYQTITGPELAPTAYTAPNGGRPWGVPIGASLGNIHDLRYRWRSERAEVALDIPIPVPCDVALFASVRQNDPSLNPAFVECCVNAQFAALSPEDQFLVAYAPFAQYGTIAGSLVFDENIGEEVP